MDAKSPFRSKTLWLNVFGMMILLLKMSNDPSISNLIPPTHYGMMFILVSNIIVRFYTTCSIAFNLPAFNTQPPSQAEIDVAIKLHDEQVIKRNEIAAKAALDLLERAKIVPPIEPIAVIVPVPDKPAKVILDSTHYPLIKR